MASPYRRLQAGRQLTLTRVGCLLQGRQRRRIFDAELADAYAANAVHTVYVANCRVYGACTMWHAMKRPAHDMGRDQVARLVARALDAVPFGWLTGEEAYGQVGRIRMWLESRGVDHILSQFRSRRW